MQNLKGAINKLLEISEFSWIMNTGQQTLTVFLYTSNMQSENSNLKVIQKNTNFNSIKNIK